jgi:serine/threonine protein kinase
MRGPSYTGRVLGGRYAVGELLGEGGWGSVYAAVQRDLDRKVAIKILHVDVAISTEGVSRFQREARAAAALGHPNIAQVTDFSAGSPTEPPFLVMELLTGATLGSFLKRQVVLPAPRVAAIAFQMLAALDVAHRAGIVHRDVKPDNVFLVSMTGIEDFVKLLDFGIAKLSSENIAQLTGDGQMLGSPAFMSPEQVRSGAIDHRADLYAVGATMYFALAGRLPFDAQNIATLLTAIMDRPPTPLAAVAPGIDPRLAALVERALEKDPERRFASATDMRAALEPWVTMGAGVTPVTLQSGPTPPPGMATPVHAYGSINALAMSAPPQGMTSLPPQVYGTPAGGSPPIGNTGAPYAAGFTPAVPAPAPQKSNGAVIGLLVAIVALLVLVGLGVAGAGFYFARRPATTATSASSTPSVAPSVAPPGSVTATSTALAPSATASSPPPQSGATRVSPSPAPVIADAGGGKIIAPDAGAKKQMAGTRPAFSGGSFGKYDIAKGKAALERVMPQLSGCYAATEYEAPDHQFTSWTLTIDPKGNVTSARRTTEYDPHPRLDGCVIAALRLTKWEAIPGGGSPQISLSARTRDNP